MRYHMLLACVLQLNLLLQQCQAQAIKRGGCDKHSLAYASLPAMLLTLLTKAVAWLPRDKA